MFDKEQWRVAKDVEERVYADCLPNRVEVIPARGKQYAAYVQVPSDLFKYLKEVVKVDREALQKGKPFLYLIYDTGVWVFGIQIGDEAIDLWPYKDLPAWAMHLKVAAGR